MTDSGVVKRRRNKEVARVAAHILRDEARGIPRVEFDCGLAAVGIASALSERGLLAPVEDTGNLRVLSYAATVGPWEIEHATRRSPESSVTGDFMYVAKNCEAADAEFIAAAVNYVRALIESGSL